jgi:hypothetical protein
MVTRGEKGQLQKGSVLNPKGRPKKEREHTYLEIMVTSVTTDDWREIVNKAKDQAKRGDALARKWLADYLIGPPVQKQELTGADNGPLTVRFVDTDATND